MSRQRLELKPAVNIFRAEFGYQRIRFREFVTLVQLGGLEPPTSCSTDRRSNQLSYNCILRPGPKKGVANGRKLGATPLFGKREMTILVSSPRTRGPITTGWCC